MDSMDYYRMLEADTLARTIWGEARGEGSAGMTAVAAVILNRVRISDERDGYWWGNGIVQVCQKPFQFSCWNKSDANFRKVVAVDEGDAQFRVAMNIAWRAVTRGVHDPTGGATHYHAAGITPYWVKDHKPAAVIGRHIFYRMVDV